MSGVGDLPSMEALLGKMVMAPTATSSRFKMGEILDPQLSEPTQRKWPVRLAWRVASKTLLVRAELEVRSQPRNFLQFALGHLPFCISPSYPTSIITFLFIRALPDVCVCACVYECAH